MPNLRTNTTGKIPVACEQLDCGGQVVVHELAYLPQLFRVLFDEGENLPGKVHDFLHRFQHGGGGDLQRKLVEFFQALH